MRSATAWATAVLPEAVGPKIARTVLVTQPRPGAGELVLGQADSTQIAVDAAVAALKLLEDALDRLGRGLRHPLQALELLLTLRFREPLLVPWAQTVFAECVVRRDFLD